MNIGRQKRNRTAYAVLFSYRRDVGWLQKRLIELLNIYAPSGAESPVRSYLKPILKKLMTDVFEDSYGNLLASKKIGTGKGATVMLSAHMDTVYGIKREKRVVNKGGIITAELPDGSRTILGADDRAGIAIILSVIEKIPEHFNGTIKVAFSREEETGLVGAEKINKSFYKNVDLAIVVDRQGSRDIVVGSEFPFCCNEVGDFVERISKEIGLNYSCVKGRSSDACIFAKNGVNTVNLSAGYQNEHTEFEFLSIYNMKDTINLILMILSSINDSYQGFANVPRENKWIANSECEKEFIWEEEEDDCGLVCAYMIDGKVTIKQGEDEIIMSPDNFFNLSRKIVKTFGKT